MRGNKNLFCLASGAAVNALIESDVLGAEEAEKTEYETFMKSRIIDKTLQFHAPIMKLNTQVDSKTCQSVREQEETVRTESVS